MDRGLQFLPNASFSILVYNSHTHTHTQTDTLITMIFLLHQLDQYIYGSDEYEVTDFFIPGLLAG